MYQLNRHFLQRLSSSSSVSCLSWVSFKVSITTMLCYLEIDLSTREQGQALVEFPGKYERRRRRRSSREKKRKRTLASHTSARNVVLQTLTHYDDAMPDCEVRACAQLSFSVEPLFEEKGSKRFGLEWQCSVFTTTHSFFCATYLSA